MYTFAKLSALNYSILDLSVRQVNIWLQRSDKAYDETNN